MRVTHVRLETRSLGTGLEITEPIRVALRDTGSIVDQGSPTKTPGHDVRRDTPVDHAVMAADLGRKIDYPWHEVRRTVIGEESEGSRLSRSMMR